MLGNFAYSKFSTISLLTNKMLVIRAGRHKVLSELTNREDPDKTASKEAVWSGSALFVYVFLAGN